jgi:SAM-dependent methyltransferase
MKNVEKWFPTKYEFRNKRLRASRKTKFLSVSSRLMTDITAEFYQQYLPRYAKGNLADLGCGNVPFYEVYKDLVDQNVCADWPNSAHQNQYLDIACNLNEPLPFSDATFDTIILSEVMEHIAEPELVWSELARILKPKGHVIISVPFLYKVHEAPHDYYRYTEFALRNFARKNNFEVLELLPFGGLPEVLTDITAKNMAKIPLIGKYCSSLLQWLCWSFIHTRFGKKISRQTAVAYPIGYFLVVKKS